MSSWTEGEKSPLLPPSAQEFLVRRGAELVGLGFALVSLVFFAILGTYNPGDPSWFNATPDRATNMLGAAGALIADPIMRTLGLAAWGIPIWFLVWSLRLITHSGDHRVWSRLIIAPIAVIAAAAFASAHAPMTGWALATGLGGMIGDAGFSILLDAAPMAAADSFKLATLGLAFVTLLLAALGLGVSWVEARVACRFLVRSLIAAIVELIRLFARVCVWAASTIRAALAKPRSEKVEPPEPLGFRRAEPSFAADPDVDFAPPSPLVDDDDEGFFPAAPEVEPDEAPVLPSILRRQVDRPPVERTKKPIKKSKMAKAEEEPMFDLGEDEGDRYQHPALSLLQSPKNIVRHTESDVALEENARMLESVLDDYGVRGEIGAVRPGPVVTMYELEPAPGLKASRVI
ncbi:MAG: DNA translocase FtsK 4TM domain-containing protein, partial [Pseudomonadota bacterium]